MLLEEQGIDGSVIATDLSTAALQRTAAARYATRELSGLSPGRIASHLTRTADGWQVNAALRDRVRVLHHNLLDPLPPEVPSCQVIFCRNVLIYFSPEHARAFLDRVADTFPPSTALFLGAAETIWQVSDRFEAVPAGDTFIYRQAIAGTAAVRTRAGTAPPALGRDRRPRRRAPTTLPSAGNGPPRRLGPDDRAAPSSRRAGIRLPRPTAGPGRQEAIAAGDFGAAVVAFRKWAYLAPHDPVAHLHLGLALEAAGDDPSAQRAYAAARHALLEADPAPAMLASRATPAPSSSPARHQTARVTP